MVAGDSKGVEDSPIYLRVHTSRLPDLTVVDLPGITCACWGVEAVRLLSNAPWARGVRRSPGAVPALLLGPVSWRRPECEGR